MFIELCLLNGQMASLFWSVQWEEKNFTENEVTKV
jgi:hypothetical protein